VFFLQLHMEQRRAQAARRVKQRLGQRVLKACPLVHQPSNSTPPPSQCRMRAPGRPIRWRLNKTDRSRRDAASIAPGHRTG
jgi:hypothetical protein